jgi:large subunit ribosomal protein L17
MRHGKKNNHLGRTASHRKSLLSNLANSLILNKRIVTTLAKAKELRKYVEPILTKSKDDSTHNRRTVFSYLKNKESIKTLFGEVSEKIANRNGGYTRIIKLGTRSGDAAETALIELVDYNEILLSAAAEKPAKTRRSRRSSGKGSSDATAAAAASAGLEDVVTDALAVSEDVQDVPSAEVVEEAPVAEEIQEEAPAAEVSTIAEETVVSESSDEPVAETSEADQESASSESDESGEDDKPEGTPDDENKPEA